MFSNKCLVACRHCTRQSENDTIIPLKLMNLNSQSYILLVTVTSQTAEEVATAATGLSHEKFNGIFCKWHNIQRQCTECYPMNNIAHVLLVLCYLCWVQYIWIYVSKATGSSSSRIACSRLMVHISLEQATDCCGTVLRGVMLVM
jgi:hypothetical protein